MTTTVEKTKLDEFEQLLEESFAKSYSVADIVEGTVIRRDKEGYLVSVKGAKTEAVLPDREMPTGEEGKIALIIGALK